MMKRFTQAIGLLLAAALLLPILGCSQGAAPAGGAPSAPAQEGTHTIVDHNGDTVTLPRKVERIAVCDILPLPSVLAVFFDSAEKIVGMSETSMSAAKNSLLAELYPEITKAQTGFINGSEVNVEELLALNPDVVFYNATSAELGEQLKGAGFNAVAISVNKWDYDAIETLNNWIALLGEIFPENDKTQVVADYSQRVYDDIQARVADLTDEQRQRVFFLFKYSESAIMTSGAHFFGQWWAESVGAVNVAQELTSDNAVQVNMEQVYQWNPEKVLITNFTTAQPEDLYANTVGNYDWQGVAAVEQRQAHKMPLGMYRSYTPGVDTPMTLLWMAKTIYPDRFADIDLTAQVQDYYQTVFGVSLTDAQAESIFTPPAQAGAGF